VTAGPARADGDPASDVLASQPLFLPSDAGVPAAQQAQIGGLIAVAARSGYRVRVAMLASPADLGSVGALWQQPENYARFLGQELSLVYQGPLLVVMPRGYGVYRGGAAALSGLGPPGAALGSGTLAAVQRLAAAAGHPVAVPSVAPRAAPGSSDVLPWLVFALGALLIAVAWSASLRARPLALGRRAPGMQ